MNVNQKIVEVENRYHGAHMNSYTYDQILLLQVRDLLAELVVALCPQQPI